MIAGLQKFGRHSVQTSKNIASKLSKSSSASEVITTLYSILRPHIGNNFVSIPVLSLTGVKSGFFKFPEDFHLRHRSIRIIHSSFDFERKSVMCNRLC